MTRLVAIIIWVLALAFPAAAAAQAGGGTDDAKPEDTPVDMDNPTFVPTVKVGKVLVAKRRAAYNRLVANVKKVLPIAKEVNKIIIETYEYMQTLPNKKARDEHMKRVEDDIKRRYTPRMKKLSYSQGKLLIKLVYRECNSSAYDLIRAFISPVRAGFYQAFAWAFGASLMKKYDPEKTDRLTERVVLMVESGQL